MWKVHCHRDFKEERPEEYESWREMYLRLQDAREQRLRLLTNNIRSAHANKPKGTGSVGLGKGIQVGLCLLPLAAQRLGSQDLRSPGLEL